MEQFFKKIGWTSILTSIVFLVVGLIIAYHPETTFKFVSYIMGVVIIIIGAIRLVEYFKTKQNYEAYNYELVYGIIAILLGLVVMICSSFMEAFLRIAIGIWIIYSGVIRISAGIRLKTIGANQTAWITMFVIAGLMILGGFYVVSVQGAIVAAIGWLMVVYSIMDIVEEVIFMQNVKNLE